MSIPPLPFWKTCANYISIAAGYAFMFSFFYCCLEILMRISYGIYNLTIMRALAPRQMSEAAHWFRWSTVSIFYVHDLVFLLLSLLLVIVMVRCKGPF